MKLGLAGYGFGGRWFHAPFIRAAGGGELAGIVVRSPDRVADARADFPDVPVFASLTDMIAAGGIEAVAVSTPPSTRVPLVMEAIAAGLHVVADKPFAFRTADALRMVRAAEAAGVVIAAYQNRRWDSDLRTLAKVIADGSLGRVQRVHNRMDFPSLDGLLPGPEGGLLGDLGSHLVDQMLWLLGPAVSVFAQTEQGEVPGGRTEVGFTVTLRHPSGAVSFSEASKANHLHARDLRAYGETGVFVVRGADAQVAAVLACDLPVGNRPDWGVEPEEAWGTLYLEGGAQRVPAVQTRYAEVYESFARAVTAGTAPPVPPSETLHTVAVLEAARASAAAGQVVELHEVADADAATTPKGDKT
ncbi:Gfo/Idh/MocA family oxidoreductase [Salipiger sp. IMCC34102]|uniref:Gfo/Idh/MocA family protein n=1 Tax=Salipiger sp. IMCC34102 TaxID=2510647 RepID=UPI00101D16F8|nr:Gfo/Idh/MocA family oxidoreductase [Salipiger sp. IMCC34102]RYH01335.1 Gfo/Idh/MocA family oxidoreductase [Salipiger sp. IMCC34102]